ncbi:aldehyde ferredoxin oxidoreductase family protein [Candidatus Omnitrophota bacterium]
MSNLYGYAGKLLRVDLTNEIITEDELDETTARKYLGGTGIGAKYLYDEVPAGVEWSDEGNRMIIATGPLGGTKIGGSGTFSVITKGPITNGAGAGQANGVFGAYLKFAGYDGIIVQGKANRWVYLYIHDGKAELRDASYLKGKGNWDTTDLIKSELGQTERGMSVISIGQAGENMVRYAGVFADKAHAAAHGGIGAVLGAKKLKAIAVARRNVRLNLKDEKHIAEVAEQFLTNLKNAPEIEQRIYKWGTLTGLTSLLEGNTGILPIKNYTTNLWDIEPAKLDKFRATYIRENFEPRRNPCWACQFNHTNWLTITEGPHKGCVIDEPEYEAFASFGPVIGVTDVTQAMYLAHMTDDLGLDCNETGWVLGLAIECFEKGVLTSKDTDGIELSWGNFEAVEKMMRKIANREGFGDILAEGAVRAAQRIGRGAQNFAVGTMKGNTPVTHDHRSRWPMLFDTCLSQVGVVEGYEVLKPAEVGLSIKPSRGTNTSAEDTIIWNAQTKGAFHFLDSMVACRYTTRNDIKLLSEAVSAATGWDFSPKEAMEAGRRIVNLLRVFNIRHGHTVEMDYPSPRYASIPEDGPAKGTNIMAHWDEMRCRYYELMGWDKETGKPLPETLRSLGLEHTVPELWGDTQT